MGNTVSYDFDESKGLLNSITDPKGSKTSLSDGRVVGFKYNDAGIRTEKRVNGVTTKYYLDGDKVISQQDEEGTSIRYNYDANGKLVSIILNGTEYFYIRNAQSDTIGLIDTSGNQVVSYTYDTWGKLISITGSLKDTVGVKNPYRYRGYRYDTETGLYYLQSRYYNPEWGRFINIDAVDGSLGELLSHNVFAYCGNNPVTRFDPDGYDWMDSLISWIFGESGNKPSQSQKMWEAYFAGIQSAINNFAQEISSMVEGLCRSIDSEERINEIVGACSDFNCFVAGIQVETKDGPKSIEDIKPGDEVYSENPETGEKEFKKVKQTFGHEVDTLVHVSIGNTKLDTTEGHKFWVVGKGQAPKMSPTNSIYEKLDNEVPGLVKSCTFYNDIGKQFSR